MAYIFNYNTFDSKKDIWDADEKAKDIRNYTTPEQTLKSLSHCEKIFEIKRFQNRSLYKFF